MTYTERSNDDVDAANATARDRFATWRRADGLFRERREAQAFFMAMEMMNQITDGRDEIELWARIIESYVDLGERLLHPHGIQSSAEDATLPSEPPVVVFGGQPWSFHRCQLIRFAPQNLIAGNVIPLQHSASIQQRAEAAEESFQDAGVAQEIVAGHHQLSAHEPASSGGTNNALDPLDLLLAGLGICTSVGVAMNVRRKQWSLESVVVRLRYSKVHAVACADCETLVEMIERDRELASKQNQ